MQLLAFIPLVVATNIKVHLLSQWGCGKKLQNVIGEQTTKVWNAYVNTLIILMGFFFVMLMQWKPSETFPQRSTWGFFLRCPILWIVRITGCRGVEGCHWVSLGVTGCYWVGCELGLSRLDRDLKTGLWVESNMVDHISTFSWEMHNEGSLLVLESWVVGKWVSENQINLLTTTFFRILIWKSHDQTKTKNN